MSKLKTFKNIGCAVIVLFLFIQSFTACSSANENDKEINMGCVGNKITVDGTIAYVAGENKILVPYDFSGNFSTCESQAMHKHLKGCKSPRLPTNETDDLPEEVAREIVSFYGDVGGFWTSLKATHSTIEFADQESKPLHYAGIMDNCFSIGKDGVADYVYGYCLNGVEDDEVMGLLVLYDITRNFEFVDIEDTANQNYSTEPIYD